MLLQNELASEQDRWPLWLPVALGAGSAAYFALPAEPPVLFAWITLGLTWVSATLAILGRARWRFAFVWALLAALMLGFGLAKLRETKVRTPVLERGSVVHLTGRLVSLEPREKGVRVILEDVRSGGLDPLPRRVRIAMRTGADFQPGDWLSLTARLDTPPGPSAPGAHDLGRRLYFQSIGAVGFAYGRAHAVPPAHPPSTGQRIGDAVERLRLGMTQAIQTALQGSTGGIAASLITGERGGISEEDEDALRDAGLAHVLAISGLQMAMVGGGIFWLLRALLAAIPALALHYPIKKWSALGALAASIFYLTISGAAPSAVRAFVMFAVLMLAVLLDRPALTMRSLALAAAILLALQPEAITDPGFQMSFAAVAGLVAVAEWESRKERSEPRGALYRYAHGTVMTSLIGSLATLPYALFYFERATHYTVLGNLIAMPVMGLWIMPMAALSVVLMPFGLEAVALDLMGRGIEIMVALGRWVSGLPGAVSLSQAMPHAALVLISLGGLWLALWQKRWRWWGLAPVLIGAVLAWRAPLPDMLVASDAATIAVRGEDGLLHFLRKPQDKYAARDWLRRDGDGRDIEQAVGLPGTVCDGLGCVVSKTVIMGVSRRTVTIAAGLRPEALEEDCRRAQVVINAAQASACNGPLVIDRRVAEQGQGWRVSLSPMPSAVSVRQWRGERPWVVDRTQ